MEQDEEGNFYVEGIKVILKDVMGTNGVIHIIDDVIVPETARSVSQALEQKGRATLKELFELAEINEDFPKWYFNAFRMNFHKDH